MANIGMAPLAMSVTKDDLVKRLNLSLETYNLMAKETNLVYSWLIADCQHLKENCKMKPPYDWSDITEKAKYEAMEKLAKSGDAQTSNYWNIAASSTSDNCPNWIARWFLYHKFRYRDGRNKGRDGDRGSSSRQSTKSQSPEQSFSTPSHKTQAGYSYNQFDYDDSEPNYQNQDRAFDQTQSYTSATTTPSFDTSAPSSYNNNSSYAAEQSDFYDPVRGWKKK